MSFYGKTFYNLISLIFKRQTNADKTDEEPKYDIIEFGPTTGKTEITLGSGLALDASKRTISTNLQLTANIEEATLNINFSESTKEETK